MMAEQTDRLERLNLGARFFLLDGKEQLLGGIEVTEIEDDAVTGTFRAAPAFAAVRDLFAQHAEAIDDMMMAKEDQLHTQIDALGVHLATPERKPGPLIHGVIIRENQSEIYFHLRAGYRADFGQLTPE